MRNRHKWYSILLIGLVLLLVSSVIGCSQYTEDEVAEIAADSYELGYLEGQLAASEPGYDDGYYDGYNEGYDKGSMEGYEECQRENESIWSDAYRQGYDDGYNQGYQDGIIGESNFYDTEHDVSDFFIEVISLTTPVSPGEYATIEVQTLPNELLAIEVWYKSGKSEAEGLTPKRANDEGYVSWTWKVGTRTTPGFWEIIIASLNLDWWFQGYENITESVYIEVR
jgi:hypothetical protein